MLDGGKRIEWIDSWKGLLITLVVLGHVVGMGVHFTAGYTQSALAFSYKVIYIFHMPAFFLLAGVLWRSNARPFGAFLSSKFRRLLVPYFVFGVCSVLAYFFMSCYFNSVFSGATTAAYHGKECTSLLTQLVALVHAGGWPGGHGFQSNSVLWFLPCMFSLEVLAYWMDRWMPSMRVQLLVAVAMLFLSVVVNKHCTILLPYGLALVPYYFFYFAVGRWLNFCDTVYGFVRGRGWLCVAGCVITYCTFCYVLPNGIVASYDYMWRGLFSIVAIMGIYVSMIVARSLSSMRVMQVLGVYSISIMLIHKFVMLAVQLKVPIVKSLLQGGGWRSLTAVVLVTCVSIAVSFVIGVAIKRWAPWAVGERRIG